jgi:hypothetical protein
MWITASRSDRLGSRCARLALLPLVVAAAPARAQDTHYWSIQYGPIGQLVGGQLIGGVNDLSATFYNPGALALRNESSYLLSTESFQWETASTDVSPGPAVLDMSSSNFGAAPSLLAGVLPGWFGPRTSLAWSFLTRQKLDVRIGQRLNDSLAGGWQHSAAESYFDQDAKEDWAGLTVSHAPSDAWGMGLTVYGVYRGQRQRNELSVHAIADEGSSLSASGVADFDYSHYRALAKLGLARQTRVWKFGLSVTTPSLGVFGSGKAAFTLSLAGVDADQDGTPDAPALVSESNDELDTDYRSSWAVGAGASRSYGDTRLYASAEWFAPVGRFDVIQLPEGATGASRLTQELGQVLNAGLGFQHAFSPDVSVYGAFHTDFSAALGSARANVAVSDWDIYHLSGGVSFRIHQNSFTVGASWARGGKQRPLDTAVPPETVPGAGLERTVDIHYQKLTFLLGFVFGR